MQKVSDQAEYSDDSSRPKTMKEFQTSGLLWLVNRVVFHPRGWALGMCFDLEGNFLGWDLSGDGKEVWEFGLPEGVEQEMFEKVEAMLRPKS